MRVLRVAGLVSAVSASAFLTGCASYSFRGAHETAKTAVLPGETAKYRLGSYECEISYSTVTTWSIAHFAGAGSTDQAAIEGGLRKLNPRRWSDASDAILVDVRVGEAESDVSWFGGTMAYLLTLGCWPANIMTYKDKVPVAVSVGGREMKGGARYRAKGYLSVWLPFALWRTDDQDGYTGEHRHGNGIMTAPHTSQKCLTDMKDVFAAELAAEIEGLLDKLEDGR
jgi:hypothetical protein